MGSKLTQMPFDINGHMLTMKPWGSQGVVWHERKPFAARLQFNPTKPWDHGYGFSDALGKTYWVKYADLPKLFEVAVNGVVEGRFDFDVKGGYYGVVYLGVI